VRHQGWLEEIILNSKKETKFIAKIKDFTTTIDIVHLIMKKHAGNREKSENLQTIETPEHEQLQINGKIRQSQQAQI
jgi:hypothetical protein